MGTRPDVVKLWSVYNHLKQESDIQTYLSLSGQHISMAQEALDCFDIQPDIFGLISDEDRETLSNSTAALIKNHQLFIQVYNPDLVVVHGDVQTALAAALAAYYNKIPVAHIEAGLRTSKYESPHPEEGIRRLIADITRLHFAPTRLAHSNLAYEGVNLKWITVTGNTVVDALYSMINTPPTVMTRRVKHVADNRKCILVTCHRRENWGEPIVALCQALSALALQHPEYYFIWPVHDNPMVRQTVDHALSTKATNIEVTEPMEYRTFIQLLHHCNLVITDSGGVLEEAVSLEKPVIVLRTETERPECVRDASVRLIGTDVQQLATLVPELIRLRIAGDYLINSIVGDGNAGLRIVQEIKKFLGGQHA